MTEELILKLAVEVFVNTGCCLTSVFLGQHIGTFLSNKFNIKRLTSYNDIVQSDYIESELDSIQAGSLNVNHNKELLPYMTKLLTYFMDHDLKIARHNYNFLDVEKKFFSIFSGLSGTYSPRNNRLKYKNKTAIGHELLHMASSFYDEKKKISLSGFSQTIDGKIIGDGINEGYTELLASRIFNKNGKPDTYKKEVKIARLLELFFDDPDDMADMYFNCNLPGLIHQLEKYGPSSKEVIKFILGVDILNYYGRIVSLNPMIKSIKAQTTLYNWFLNGNKDPEKLKKFEEILCENKFMALIVNNKKMKLQRDNKYANAVNHNPYMFREEYQGRSI